MSDQDQIRELMARYCWRVDHGQWDDWLALFTADASWRAGDAPPFEGREGLAKLTTNLAKRIAAAPSRHFVTNELVEVSGETASLQCYLMVVRLAANDIGIVGEYSVDLVRQAGGWLIQRLQFNRIDGTAATA